MKTSKLSKELKVVIDEFVVYPTIGPPIFVRFTKHLAYITLHQKGKLITHQGLQSNCKLSWSEMSMPQHVPYRGGRRTHLVPISNVKQLTVGSTICGPKDKCNEITGMKVALTRALRGYEFGRNVRSQIWAAFHAWVRENYE